MVIGLKSSITMLFKRGILMDEEEFKHALYQQGIELNEQQMDQFETYYVLLVERNKKVNLTTLTEKKEVYLKHFYDSITAAFYFDFTNDMSLCDVGAGAGFPSIPLKICFPQIEITIVDSLKKRIEFLKDLSTQLLLDDVSFHHARAEDFGQNKKYREKFDAVIARAVARMAVLNELCLPLVAKEGTFIAMKGAQGRSELEESKKTVELLGGKCHKVHEFVLPEELSERTILLIDKINKTSKKYPRKAGTPNKNPIV